MFSVSGADDRTLEAEEGLFRRPLAFKSASAMMTFGWSFGSIPGVLSARVEVSLSRLISVDRKIVAGFLELLMELELFFLTGMTTLSPPSPKRENLGTGSVVDIQFSLGSRDVEGGPGWFAEPGVERGTPRGIDWLGKGRNADGIVGSSLTPRWCPNFTFRFLRAASWRMALRAHGGMVGNGGATAFVLSVRAVRDDEEEARLVVEERKLDRFFLGPALSVSLVVRDVADTIERRFEKSRSLVPSSTISLPLFSSFSLSPPPRMGTGDLPVVALEMVDGGDGSGAGSET